MTDASSGELTFSKRIGFLEQGKDVDDMMHHTAKMMDYTGVVSTTSFYNYSLPF